MSLIITLNKLKNKSLAELRLQYVELYKRPYEQRHGKDQLIRDISYRIQELHYNNHTKVNQMLDKLAKDMERGKPIGIKRHCNLQAGTRLVKTWQGGTYEVFVKEDGFMYQNKRYASLSKIATEITGTRRNGPLFWGLRK